MSTEAGKPGLAASSTQCRGFVGHFKAAWLGTWTLHASGQRGAPACHASRLQAVKTAARDVLFRQAQDRVARQLYFDPSQRLAKSLGLR